MTKNFLEENATKPDVITTESGLQFRVIKEGKGKSPRRSDKVTVHYEGKLVNGKVFDSSYKRGKPAQFRANQVIPGWTEALLMMKKGSIWEVFIPAHLGYGEKGISGVIPSNATLIFKIELIKPKSAFLWF